MARVSRYGRFYSAGSYYDRFRTILAVILIALYILAKFAMPALAGLFIGMNVPVLIVAFLLFLGWPVGAMHDKRVAVGIMVVFLLLLFFHII